ncbi:hypothetical protein ABTZ59_33925 [Streptomyces sp. NPDC094034]|uniref:hypothetical protein n=1 Tax=Streptomyces sp. NPDC094034 TaxID=3155309 RepID=UPI00331A6DF5
MAAPSGNTAEWRVTHHTAPSERDLIPVAGGAVDLGAGAALGTGWQCGGKALAFSPPGSPSAYSPPTSVSPHNPAARPVIVETAHVHSASSADCTREAHSFFASASVSQQPGYDKALRKAAGLTRNVNRNMATTTSVRSDDT